MILQFFNHVLILGKEEKNLSISQKVYDLIYELNHICPSVLLAVLPQVSVMEPAIFMILVKINLIIDNSFENKMVIYM